MTLEATSAWRILIVGPSWVGDMVMAQSLFRVLKKTHPDCIIDVLAPEWSLPLLERMPEVRTGIAMPFGHGQLDLAGRWRFGQSLRGQYDQAIVLPNSLKSAIIPFAARIKQRTGWQGELRYGLLNDRRRLNKKIYTMTVQRFVALAYKEKADFNEIPALKFKVKVADAFDAMQSLGLEKQAQSPVLALCPGAEFGDSKRWPEDKYAQIAKSYLDKGWHVWLFGSEKDQPSCEKINQISEGRCSDLSGRTKLAQAVDLMSLADAVVANDSGLMHVAAALNKPLVAIYGSTDPKFTPPLNRQNEIVSLGLECSPCFKRECPLGHLDCMNKLDVSIVDAALSRVKKR